MAAHPSSTERSPGPPSDLGARLVALAGIGLMGYGVMFLIRNFTGFVELGLTPEHIGGTAEQIRDSNPRLFYYVSHLQVAVAGFIIALGVAGIPLAWQGIRTGQRWVLRTAFLAPVIGVGLALPLHYVYGIATLGHLGMIYLDAVILLIGTVLAHRALARRADVATR